MTLATKRRVARVESVLARPSVLTIPAWSVNWFFLCHWKFVFGNYFGLPNFLPQLANFFTRIYPSHPWHFPTLLNHHHHHWIVLIHFLSFSIPRPVPYLDKKWVMVWTSFTNVCLWHHSQNKKLGDYICETKLLCVILFWTALCTALLLQFHNHCNIQPYVLCYEGKFAPNVFPTCLTLMGQNLPRAFESLSVTDSKRMLTTSNSAKPF